MFTKMGLLSAVTFGGERLTFFHDHGMLVVVLVLTLVGGVMSGLLTNSFTSRSIYEEQSLEIVWTTVPAVLLAGLAVPSLRILYLSDEIINPFVTIKCIGHQWYWSYEYSDGVDSFVYDSYMVSDDDLAIGGLRSLDVDNRMVMPVDEEIRLLVTSTDVIHSWAVPSFSLKMDAIPGRLNEMGVMLSEVGVYYGQCSEICGVNHSFMPIAVDVVVGEVYNKIMDE